MSFWYSLMKCQWANTLDFPQSIIIFSFRKKTPCASGILCELQLVAFQSNANNGQGMCRSQFFTKISKLVSELKFRKEKNENTKIQVLNQKYKRGTKTKRHQRSMEDRNFLHLKCNKGQHHSRKKQKDQKPGKYITVQMPIYFKKVDISTFFYFNFASH